MRKWMLVVTSLLIVGLAPATAGALTSGRVVPVTLNEFNILLGKQSAPVGKVTFVLTNKGKMTHEFVVIRSNRPAGSLLKGKEADEAGAVGEEGAVRPGETKRLTLTLRRGHYALLCNLPGHYLGGQFVDFYVH